MDLDSILLKAIEMKSSDIHLSEGEPPIVRIDGDLQRLEAPPLTHEDLKNMMYGIMTDEQKKMFEEDLQLDFGHSVGDSSRVRINMFMQSRGISVVFRVIPFEIPTLEKLGLIDPVFRTLSDLPNGLVLVTGPTGSGKSTTLAAMIDYINDASGHHHHILTVEDPIEYVYKSKNCLIHQREVGAHARGFNEALRVALREDPDVILIGEMRDLETIRLAMTAAETGHLVFGTLHTVSAPKTVHRIIDAFPAGEKSLVRAMLSSSLRGVIAQTLMKRVGGGRVAVSEIMVTTPAIKNMIREDKISQMTSAIETGREMGMRSWRQHFDQLLGEGKVEMPENEAELKH